MTKTTLLRGSALLMALALLAIPAAAQVNGTIQVNNARQRGTAGGQILLYSPDPVQQGSSISHWDVSAFPNLLMEPSINPDLPFLGLDVTPGQMQDVGWTGGNSNFNITDLDPPGTGFTDPTPFAGAPGNPATTLGEARVNLFNALLSEWGSTLQSGVDIDVLVTWQSLTCIQGVGAVLAAAGSTFIIRDNPALPLAGTWYHAALAEALAGTDLTGSPAEGGGDIIVFMNSDIDLECLAPGTGYYYGLDGNTPPNNVSVSEVVLHELAHGLGFSNFTSEATGELAGGFPSIYDVFTLDQTTGKTWNQMTDAERRASATNVRKVTWNGAQANAAALPVLGFGVPELVINAPGSVAGTYEIGTASFGPPIPDGGLTGEIACLKDDTSDATLLNGCTAATNPGELAGKIALIDRGGCSFVTKVANAQAAGAIGAIIVNNNGNSPPGLGGSDPTITIPAVSLGRRDGNRIRKATCPGSAAFLQDDRFQVTAAWATADNAGEGTAVLLTEDSGYFYFFNPNNVELIFKVLDACTDPFNRYWVFAAGLTDVEVTLTVTDTQNGEIRQYFNPFKTAFPPIQDTDAFATCP